MVNLDYHIVSHLIYTGKAVIKNGFITFNSLFEIQKLESKTLGKAESARTQFYSGMVLPAIYPPKYEVISLRAFVDNKLNPSEYMAIDASTLRYDELISIVRKLQLKHNLFGDKFLAFWNKLSLNIAKQEEVNYTIEPKNKLPLMNIQGVDLIDYTFSDLTRIKNVKL